MVVFRKLCRTAWSSRVHKTESVSVMGHARSAVVFHGVIPETAKLLCQCSVILERGPWFIPRRRHYWTTHVDASLLSQHSATCIVLLPRTRANFLLIFSYGVDPVLSWSCTRTIQPSQSSFLVINFNFCACYLLSQKYPRSCGIRDYYIPITAGVRTLPPRTLPPPPDISVELTLDI